MLKCTVTLDEVCKCLNVLFYSLFKCVCMGILLGSGQQKIAAVANFFGYYCIGLPLGISLMFAAKLDVVGLFSFIFSFYDLINSLNCHSLYSLIFCELVIFSSHHVSICFINHNFIGLKHVENMSGPSTGPCRIALICLEHREQHSLKHFCNEITAVLEQCPLLLSQAFGWDF